MTPRAIVTDIEGTTSSIAYVHQVLFPYSRERLAPFVERHGELVAPILADVRAAAGDPALSVPDCIALLTTWHDADRKIAPLKTLQGLIWADGYHAGELHGHIYEDAAAGLRRWYARGIALAVYSSGSVAAQKLLFGHSECGDLTPLFSAWFDTATGAKQDAAAYRAISNALALAPAEIMFLSDVEAELAAADAAGLAVTLLAREGLPAASSFPVATSFAEILAA